MKLRQHGCSVMEPRFRRYVFRFCPREAWGRSAVGYTPQVRSEPEPMSAPTPLPSPPVRRKRLAILVNMVAPYRVPVYEELGGAFETLVLFSGRERNRGSWERVLGQFRSCRWKQVWGFALRFARRAEQGAIDQQYLHLDPGYFFELLRYRPHAVISNEMGFRTLAALFYGFLFRRPVWVWWGGTLHTERNLSRRKRAWRKWFVGRVRRWISYGETSTEYLESLGVSRERVLQIQNCVDERRFQPEGERLIDVHPKPVVLYTGQMIRRKGVDRLIESAARLQSGGAEFSLLLVGGGAEAESLQEQAASLGLRHLVFHGAVAAEQMPAVYRSADLVVFPTLEDVWGLTANEAILCGKPVLTSIYAGCAEEIIPSEQRFDPHDPDQFDKALGSAIRKGLIPPSRDSLWTCERTGKTIAEAISSVFL